LFWIVALGLEHSSVDASTDRGEGIRPPGIVASAVVSGPALLIMRTGPLSRTKPSESLVKFSQNVDVLIHELGQSKQDPRLTGPPDELIPSLGVTRRQARTIVEHHTDAAEAGQVFQRVQPKLAVFSHYPNIVPAEVLRLVRESYSGPVEFGEDLMTIEIGNAINIRRLAPTNKQ
jgi:hypothetical protein